MKDGVQTALVTGAAGSLGRAMARSLRESGICTLAPGRSELDMYSADGVKNYFSGARDVDLLICNAGMIIDKPLDRMAEQDWDEVMQVNLRGAFLCAREVSRGMTKRRRGHIVFVSSFSALHPPSGQANYAAAKAALLGMMKSLARELGSRNTRVNAVLPGFLETSMTDDLPDAVKNSVRSRHVLGRFNTSCDVARFITFLHRQMPHTSGQVFNLDSRVI